MEKLSSDRSSTATVLHYQPCKFGEDRSSRCSDDCSDKIYKNILKQQHFTSPVAQSGWANKCLDIQSSDSHACHRQWGECDCYQHWRWRHQLTSHTRCDQLGAGPATPNHPNITQPATRLVKQQQINLFIEKTHTHTHTHTQPFNGPLSGTTRVRR